MTKAMTKTKMSVYNEIQGRFLDPAFCLQTVLTKHGEQIDIWKQKWMEEAKKFNHIEGLRAAVGQPSKKFDMVAPSVSISNIRFEVNKLNVLFSLSIGAPQYSKKAGGRVLIFPAMDDNYPKILQKFNSLNVNYYDWDLKYLATREWTGSEESKEQMVAIFKKSNIEILWM